ncbi:hypothetical protein KAX06_08155 [candidate division WOR-3 bacterium]|nr:hypothetical protein [candidate division WOR-3 bacterium]
MKKSCVNLVVAAVVFIVYLTGCTRNEPPVIDSLVTDPAADTLVTAGDTVRIICEASDPDADSLLYEFEADAGTFAESQDTASVLWIAPNHSGTFEIICTVSDGDSLYEVTDTLAIEVQNYFPMALQNSWSYKGSWLGQEITLEISVLRKEEEEGKDNWRMYRFFEFATGESLTDTFSYYSIVGDSIFFSSSLPQTFYLNFLMPLWIDKTWNAGDGITASVVEKDTVGTDGGIFFNCFKVNIQGIEEDFTYWVAPDVGIIVQTVKIPIIGVVVDFELTDYTVD